MTQPDTRSVTEVVPVFVDFDSVELRGFASVFMLFQEMAGRARSTVSGQHPFAIGIPATSGIQWHQSPAPEEAKEGFSGAAPRGTAHRVTSDTVAGNVRSFHGVDSGRRVRHDFRVEAAAASARRSSRARSERVADHVRRWCSIRAASHSSGVKGRDPGGPRASASSIIAQSIATSG